MTDTLEYVAYLNAVKAKASELDNLLSNEFGFKLNEILQNYASLFNRFCPYNVGDRVKLKQTLDIEKDSGWYGSKHFLVEGAIATVKTCGDYRNNLFFFGLEFDAESYINQNGEIKLIIAKHLYYLFESQIETLGF